MRIAFVLLPLMAAAALGCPVCDTETGLAVRAGIFNESFLLTFVKVIAPFPVLGVLVAALSRHLPD